MAPSFFPWNQDEADSWIQRCSPFRIGGWPTDAGGRGLWDEVEQMVNQNGWKGERAQRDRPTRPLVRPSLCFTRPSTARRSHRPSFYLDSAEKNIRLHTILSPALAPPHGSHFSDESNNSRAPKSSCACVAPPAVFPLVMKSLCHSSTSMRAHGLSILGRFIPFETF